MDNKLEIINTWIEKNIHNFALSEKIFIAKNIYYICSSSKYSEEYEDALIVLLSELDYDMEKFLSYFRGEKIDQDGKKLYNIYYRLSGDQDEMLEEELIAILDITNVKNNNEPTTIN